MTAHHMAWFLIILGILFLLGNKPPFLGHRPGAFRVQLGRPTIVIPLGTSILGSIVLTVLLRLVR